jgi:hypothetical protein
MEFFAWGSQLRVPADPTRQCFLAQFRGQAMLARQNRARDHPYTQGALFTI